MHSFRNFGRETDRLLASPDGMMAVCVGPLWEYRQSLADISRHIWADLTRRKSVSK